VVLWTPTEVVRPAWFMLLLLLLLLLLPVLWALQRPWTITADTPDPPDTDGEHWEGHVRGVASARDELLRIVDDLEAKGYPNEPHGPLTRVASSASLRDS
jgi:hypothetical protein